jgi:hypothetical protein
LTVYKTRRWLTHDGKEDAALIPTSLDRAAEGDGEGCHGWVLELVESLRLLHVNVSSTWRSLGMSGVPCVPMPARHARRLQR